MDLDSNLKTQYKKTYPFNKRTCMIETWPIHTNQLQFNTGNWHQTQCSIDGNLYLTCLHNIKHVSNFNLLIYSKNNVEKRKMIILITFENCVFYCLKSEISMKHCYLQSLYIAQKILKLVTHYVWSCLRNTDKTVT